MNNPRRKQRGTADGGNPLIANASQAEDLRLIPINYNLTLLPEAGWPHDCALAAAVRRHAC
jgi:hypothetical protein